MYIMYIKQTTGSRAQVMHGTAKQTTGGLTKSQLKYNKQGKIVSKKASTLAKKNNRLVKAGYITRKGVFGSVNMRGGDSHRVFIPGVGVVNVLDDNGLNKGHRPVVDNSRSVVDTSRSVYVLWVRHCYSCANAADWSTMSSIYKAVARQPLCNELGVYQSYIFGRVLKIEEIKKEFGLDGITVSASYLPRAIETAKIISIGLGDNESYDNKSYDKIERIPFVSEYKSSKLYETLSTKSSQNVTTIDRSNCYTKALNMFVQGGALVSDRHKYSEVMIDTKMCKGKTSINDCVISAERSVDFPLFKENILPRLDKGKLHIIVSHGKYIEDAVLKDCKGTPVRQNKKKYRPYHSHNGRPKKIQNLEAHLIRYDLYKKGPGIYESDGIYENCKPIKKCNQDVLNHWKKRDEEVNLENLKGIQVVDIKDNLEDLKDLEVEKVTVKHVVNKVFNNEHKEFATCDYKYHDRENRNQSIEQVGVCLGPNAHINIARRRQLR